MKKFWQQNAGQQEHSPTFNNNAMRYQCSFVQSYIIPLPTQNHFESTLLRTALETHPTRTESSKF
jgi:hypothetical protein